MASDDRSVWISSNSEIYNFRELREILSSTYEFHSQSDTEVLLKAYVEWGVDCLKRLRGMFAFAVWDSRSNRIFLARDRLGIKPLYYHLNENYLLFASETRALIASGLVDPALSMTGLYQYLSFGNLQSPETLYSAIRELKPAHYLLFDPEERNPTPRRYWDPLQAEPVPVGALNERVFQCLEESVRLRMVSDAPLGAFLSGGIDSSAVVSLMKNTGAADIKTLSVVFKEKDFDESQYSQLVSSQFQTDHQALLLEEDDLLQTLPKAIAAMDQPTVDGINTYLISRSAREMGLKVALSGLGGDELFGGYDSFDLVPKLQWLERVLNTFPQTFRATLARLLNTVLPASDRNSKLIHLIGDQKSGCHVYFLLRALFCADGLRSLFADSSLLEIEIIKQLRFTESLVAPIAHRGHRDQVSYLELTHYLGNTLLRDTDVMSMAHSLEIRVPLIDHHLVELMFSIPEESKFRGGSPKPLLVNSLAKKLPDPLVFRKKMGFTLPFETWMRKNLKKEIESVLLTPVASLSGIISDAGVSRVWQDFLERRVSWSRPWALYVLKRWAAANL